MKKNTVFGLIAGILSLILICVVFLAVDFCFSFIQPADSGHMIDHGRLNHVHRPHGKYVANNWKTLNPQFPEPYTLVFNQQGWVEDYDVSLTKPENVYRIFYVGDSFTEGTAPMDGSVPSLVEKHLNEKYRDTGYRFEVINTGTSSYSPLLYFVNIKYYLLKYQPDVIVINVDMTDDFDDWKYRKNIIYDDDGEIWGVAPSSIFFQQFVDTKDGPVKTNWKYKAHLFLYKYSHFYNWLIAKKANGQKEAPYDLDSGSVMQDGEFYPRWAWVQHQWYPRTEEQVRFSMGMLDRIAKLCKERHVKLLLTGVPHYLQMVFINGERYWSRRPHDEIKKIAQKNGVAYFDSIEALEQIISKVPHDLFYYHSDMHLNPNGYALWAQAHNKAFDFPGLKLLPAEVY